MNRGLLIAVALAIAVGVFFRFDRLDGKLYTNDEATTSVHVSGHDVAQYDAAVRGGEIRRVGDLARFQEIDPKTNVADVVTGLAIEDPQHPPLYYMLSRGWQRTFGNGIAVRRALPALFAVVAIACAFGFARALVRGTSFALVLAGLIALSPFHVLYAQQAREYSLWTALILASSALLLRALSVEVEPPRRPLQRFAPYVLAVVAGLYTDVLFVFTLAAHAMYVAIAYRRAIRTVVVPYAIATIAGLAAFVPWIVVLLRGRDAVTNNSYLGAALPFKLFALKWIFNAGAVFYDLDYERHATVVVLVPVFAVVAVGAFALARGADRRAGLFVLLLAATSAIGFLMPDLIKHESRSTSARYLIPLWIAFECSAAYAIFIWLRDVKERVRVGGALAYATFGILGVASLGVAAQREYWWGDAGIAPVGPIARVVRAALAPVTIVFVTDQGGFDFGPMLLASAIDPSVRLVYLRHDARLSRTLASDTVFALDPSAASLAGFRRDGWRTDVAYQRTTTDAALAALRREAARSRGPASELDGTSSLWRLR